MLKRGDTLTEQQKREVKNAFIYRWTVENEKRVRSMLRPSQCPTMAVISDEQWINEHAFHFIADGSRLTHNRSYAEPAYMVEPGRPTTTTQHAAAVRRTI